MPINPSRLSQGGDVEGKTPIEVSQGTSISVAKASFDPGYDLASTLSDAGTVISKADLIEGYCAYGKAIGERE
jgi:hypothetical protein